MKKNIYQNQNLTILVLESQENIAQKDINFFYNEILKLISVSTVTDALAYLQKNVPDIILLNLQISESARKIIQEIQQLELDTIIIIFTTQDSLNQILATIVNCAFKFVAKTVSSWQNLEFQLNKSYNYHGFIGISKPMQTIYQIIDNVATSKASVFITGESGTGKELCAEAIHQESKRKDKPFIVINCTAIPENLMESELFGHVKGAFTGADKNRLGAASLADGGTLFLDEIGDLNLNLQAKLLRFVQTLTFQKVGSSKLEKVDIRFICATNRDPIAAIKAGNFREDLYYRLNVISIKLPALRKRGDDVLLLAKHFLRRYAKEENKSFVNFAPECETILKNYEWPGNVRQLQNVIRNIVLMNEAEIVTPEMLSSILEYAPTQSLANSSSDSETASQSQTSVKIVPLWQAEKQLIEQAIEFCGGNIAKAASLLEIDASTIYRKRRQWKKNQK